MQVIYKLFLMVFFPLILLFSLSRLTDFSCFECPLLISIYPHIIHHAVLSFLLFEPFLILLGLF